MELIRGLHNLRPAHRGCVATIGNFDGVHLGHRAIFEQLAGFGAAQGLPTTVVTFEPQPQEFFAGPNAPPRLTRFREKMLAIRETPVDRVLVLRFDRALAQMPAIDFMTRVLVDGLGAKLVLAGADFRFGRDAFGNLALLQEFGEKHQFRVVTRETFIKASGHVDRVGGRVSSSWIRDALTNGELALAAELLGRPYSICGRVRPGAKLGRTIGYPTVNIRPARPVCALSGIYVVTVEGAGAGALPGVASLGTRPTVDGRELLLEVHLFDFERDLYGRELRVSFLKKLRDELRFDSLQEMTVQIDADAAAARAFFAAESVTPGLVTPGVEA